MKLSKIFSFFSGEKETEISSDKPLLVFFCWTRTGSSNIAKLTELATKARYFSEPFHRKRGIKVPKGLNNFKKLLRSEIYPDYEIIKHNNIIEVKQNKHLIAAPNHKLVFLWRKNALKRIVSHKFAQQTKVWGLFGDREGRKNLLENFSPEKIDVGVIKSEMDNYLDEVHFYRNFLKENKDNYIEVVFEEFFAKNFDQQLAQLTQIIEFSGLQSKINDEFIEDMKWRLDPKNNKQGQDKYYKRIPNIAEIEALGSDYYGYLFDE